MKNNCIFQQKICENSGIVLYFCKSQYLARSQTGRFSYLLLYLACDDTTYQGAFGKFYCLYVREWV